MMTSFWLALEIKFPFWLPVIELKEMLIKQPP
jgi:hypothetical protein